MAPHVPCPHGGGQYGASHHTPRGRLSSQDSFSQSASARAFVVPSTAFGQSDEVEPLPMWPSIVVADQEVRIRSEQGRGVAGRVVRVDDDQLTIRYRPRLFRPFRKPIEQTFDRAGIRTIDLVDSTWNGAAIGAAGAIAFTAIAIHKDCTPSYEAGPARSVRVVPTLGRGGKGVVAASPSEAVPR